LRNGKCHEYFFLSDLQPADSVTHGKAKFDLPILCQRDDAFALYFTANYEKVKDVMPSEMLHESLKNNATNG
jgi:hypothetical protein